MFKQQRPEYLYERNLYSFTFLNARRSGLAHRSVLAGQLMMFSISKTWEFEQIGGVYVTGAGYLVKPHQLVGKISVKASPPGLVKLVV